MVYYIVNKKVNRRLTLEKNRGKDHEKNYSFIYCYCININ